MTFDTKGTAFCIELEPDGKIVSFCGYFRLSDDANLIIAYITDKDYRGQGYGSQCFKGQTLKKLSVNFAFVCWAFEMKLT